MAIPYGKRSRHVEDACEVEKSRHQDILYLAFREMGYSRILGIFMVLFIAALTQWAFRFGMAPTPVDAFVRLLVLVADVLLFIPAIAALLSAKSFSDTVRYWLRDSPRLASIYFGCVVAFGMVLAVELGCRHYFKHHYTAPYAERTEWSPTHDPMRAKGDTINHRCFVNDTLIYDCNYAIDTLGRRQVPNAHPDSTYREFALLAGCSYMFGYGVDDRQTLAFALDSISGLKPYNYAIAGQGPQHLLTKLKTNTLQAQIKESNGRLIFLFIDDHLPRLIGSRRLIKMWARDFPYLFLEDEELKQNGTFTTGRPMTTGIYRILTQSAFIDLFDIDIPWSINDAHLKLAAKVFSASQQEFLSQYPNGDFVVLIGPNSTLAPCLITQLEAAGVTYLDYSKLLDKEKPEYKLFRTEGHPNGLYYQRLAIELIHHFERNPLKK